MSLTLSLPMGILVAKSTVLQNKRICRICNSDIANDGNRQHWYRYNNGWICKVCKDRIYRKPRLSRYKNKRIVNDKRVLTGFCMCCRKNVLDNSCKVTVMAHIQYDDNNPLANRIELCSRCHAIYDWEKRMKQKGFFTYDLSS